MTGAWSSPGRHDRNKAITGGIVTIERRVALVTGAAQGIGQRTAIVLAAKGYRVVLNDLRPADETRSAIATAGGEAVDAIADVGDEAAVVAMVAETIARWGWLDVLVNNAGISLQRPAESTTLAEWERVIRINLTGPFLLCREAGNRMLARGEGSIVNISSVAGLFAVADRAAYNASKSGLIGLTRTLAAEWGGHGVRVNAVCPGWVKTPMDDADQARAGYTDADITGRIPMGRFASPDDIAQAVAFLADPALSGFVNGHCLSVDGGWAADASWESLRLAQR
jgi:NAD(P)-dependent dehydrogenase (short-subunit alcohol dehydrogenase family)